MPRPSEQAANKPATCDQELIAHLLSWFTTAARDLPWRRSGAAGQRDPYITLVSELMLQQTQVSRVLEKFEPFLRRFPTVECLANAEETDVLAAWSGLGYYRRARLLHAAAKAIQKEFGGNVPRTLEELLTIPGIGPYTAGAISSLAFNQPAPVVDGNVTRVLLRISAHPGTLGDKASAAWAWKKARELMDQLPKWASPGAWNEGLMELGATVCTPLAPRCSACPVQAYCSAFALRLVDSIPAPKDTKARARRFWATIVYCDSRGRVLLQTRPPSGLFAGLEQAPTLETNTLATAKTVRVFAQQVGGEKTQLSKLGTLEHQLTHRDITCTVYAASGFKVSKQMGGRWVSGDEAAEAAISNIQRKVLKLAGVFSGNQASRADT